MGIFLPSLSIGTGLLRGLRSERALVTVEVIGDEVEASLPLQLRNIGVRALESL